MAFWGIEVKPKHSHTLRYGDVMGKLVLTQATLGAGSSTEKSILQCEVGDKRPVYLCTLLPQKMESCPLNLEFEEEDDVKFSVVGQTSIHLSGFIQGGSPGIWQRGVDLYGEDIAETDSDETSNYSDDSQTYYDKDFINDGDMDMFPQSPLRSSGVVIEEIVDDEKPAIENGKTKHPVNKNQGRQLVVKGSVDAAILESEDEDGFPISSSRDKGPKDQKPEESKTSEGGKKKNKKKKTETKDDGVQVKSLKRKVNETTAGEEPQSTVQQDESLNPSDVTEEIQKKKKKKKDKSGAENKTETVKEDKEHPKETNSGIEDESGEKKKKKKKKKGKEEGSGAQTGEPDTAVKNVSAAEGAPKKSKTKPGNVRTFSNGLVVEEVEMGKPDGKRASAGKKVSVRYIGKLQKNGKIFDSNIGKAPFKFILGVGQVIKGWDVGVEGMRVGDKRKLTIPPSMGYGTKGVGPIPPNAWLTFDVELVDVL